MAWCYNPNAVFFVSADDSDDEEIADMVKNIGFHEIRKSGSMAAAAAHAQKKVSPSGSSVGSDEDHK